MTGSDKLNPVDVSQKINFVKKHTKLPVAVGFGISSRKSVLTLLKQMQMVL